MSPIDFNAHDFPSSKIEKNDSPRNALSFPSLLPRWEKRLIDRWVGGQRRWQHTLLPCLGRRMCSLHGWNKGQSFGYLPVCPLVISPLQIIYLRCAIMNNLRTTQVQGKHGVIMKGATFGETAILFGNTSSSATLVASGTVVLCRLRDTIFHGMISKDVIKGLQERISEIRVVVDILSGV